MIDKYLYVPEVDPSKHIIATYHVESKRLAKAAEAIAIGQSIGNPSVRLNKETRLILTRNLAKILDTSTNLEGREAATIRIAYPLENIDLATDGVTQLFAMLMGGQMDIDIIDACRLEHIHYPAIVESIFRGPKIGMDEIKRRTGATNRPLIGGIVKPKTGMSPKDLVKVCIELVKGGVDFLKEDEILGNPGFCRFDERVKMVAAAVNEEADRQGREVFYAPCINSDYPYFMERATLAAELGAKAVHLNIWAGLPAYRALRDMDLDIALFFQKSGDRVITCANHRYSVSWIVIAELARMIGVDFIHAGMWGGYLSDSEEVLGAILQTLRTKSTFKKTVPSLSCGCHPGLVSSTVKHFGTELMLSSGGSIHGHPDGTIAGARAMRQACDALHESQDFMKYVETKPELKKAIEKWGYVRE